MWVVAVCPPTPHLRELHLSSSGLKTIIMRATVWAKIKKWYDPANLFRVNQNIKRDTPS